MLRVLFGQLSNFIYCIIFEITVYCSQLDEEVVSLKQFTAEVVVEASVRCLNIIQPGLGLSINLPPSMSAKYKVGSVIAEACMVSGQCALWLFHCEIPSTQYRLY